MMMIRTRHLVDLVARRKRQSNQVHQTRKADGSAKENTKMYLPMQYKLHAIRMAGSLVTVFIQEINMTVGRSKLCMTR